MGAARRSKGSQIFAAEYSGVVQLTDSDLSRLPTGDWAFGRVKASARTRIDPDRARFLSTEVGTELPWPVSVPLIHRWIREVGAGAVSTTRNSAAPSAAVSLFA